MTHTLHRQGDPASLKNDYVLVIMPDATRNRAGSKEKLVRIMTIGTRHNTVNLGDTQQGNMYVLGKDELFRRILDGGVTHTLFTTRADLAAFLQEVRGADLGMSVVVSGLFDAVKECAQAAGLNRHTVAVSLGVWGRTGRLPRREVMELASMCGHGLVTPQLIEQAIADVRAGRLTAEQAGIELAKPCVCGAFNPVRAAELLQQAAGK